MNLDDESLLSAYLDGELEPAGRLRVEAALETDPRLAERLVELAAVRSLVGGLPRPTAGVDLAPAVSARIAARPGWRLVRAMGSRSVRLRLVTAGAGLAAAAALIVALSTTFNPPLAPVPLTNAPFPAAEHQPVELTPDEVASAPANPAPDAPTEIPVTPEPAVASVIEPDESREPLHWLLKHPEVRRLVVPVASLSSGELARVETALDHTPRADRLRGELRIEPGVPVDGDQLGGAVAYLVRLDGRELGRLRENLGDQPGLFLEVMAPEVVTLLADTGTVAYPGLPPASDLGDPPPNLPPVASAHRDPAPEPEILRPGDPGAPPPAAAPGPSRIDEVPDDDPPRLYLIWVVPREATAR